MIFFTNYIKNILINMLKHTRMYQLSIPPAYRMFIKVVNRVLHTHTHTEGYREPGNYGS